MTTRRTDMAVNAILLAVSLMWCGYVVTTIPPGLGGGDIGPRAMPLLFGVLLGLLSGGLVLHALLAAPDARGSGSDPAVSGDAAMGDDAPGSAGQGAGRVIRRRDEWIVIALVFGLLLLYGWALRMIGFNLATCLVIALTMVLCLRDRSLRRIASMSAGVTFVCWLVFGQLLDIPLATGIWINLG